MPFQINTSKGYISADSGGSYYNALGLPAGYIALYYSDVGVYSDTAMTTLQTTNGGNVNAWADQSGNSNHLINTLATAAVYATGIFGSLPAIHINGNQALQAAFSNSQPYTVFLVVEILPSISNSQALIDSAYAHFQLLGNTVWTEATNALQMISDSLDNPSTYIQTANNVIATNTKYILQAQFNTSSSYLQINNGSPVTGTVANGSYGTGLAIGCWGGDSGEGGGMPGYYAAAVLYPSALNTVQANAVLAFLNAKYGVY